MHSWPVAATRCRRWRGWWRPHRGQRWTQTSRAGAGSQLRVRIQLGSRSSSATTRLGPAATAAEILNVKPGDDDYLDTSFLLRQASPYMKIKYSSLEGSSDLVSQKRGNVSLICQENKKRRKVQKPKALVVEGKDNNDKDAYTKVSERDDTQFKHLSSELRRVTRSEEITKNFARALWTVLKQYKQKLLESENAAERLRELLKDKDVQIMDLKKELKVLNSSCSSDKFPIPEDTFVEQNDDVSSCQAAQSLVSLSNQTDLGYTDAALDIFHLVVEEVSEDFTCCGPERSSTNCDMKGGSDDCVTSVTNIIDEQEWSSRDLKPEKSCNLEAFGPSSCLVEKEIAEIEVQVADKELDRSKSCSEQTSAHDSGVTHASSYLDQPYDQSLTEMKHHDSTSSSQRVNSNKEDVGSSQSSLELPGMGAVLQNPQEVNSGYERCEPTIEKTIVEYGRGQSPNILNEHGGMFPCLLNERPSPRKDSIALKVQTKDCEDEGIADKKKDISVSRPSNTMKTKRRLLPVAGMLLKEFSGPDMEVDMKKEERVKWCGEASGRSHTLIQLLKKA